VVPTNATRKAIRNGVMSRMLVSRAIGVTGVMSPYPVVVRLTVA